MTTPAPVLAQISVPTEQKMDKELADLLKNAVGVLSQTSDLPPEIVGIETVQIDFALMKAFVDAIVNDQSKVITDINNMTKMNEADLANYIRPRLLLIQELRNKKQKLERFSMDDKMNKLDTNGRICYLNKILNLEDYIMKDTIPFLEQLAELKKLPSAYLENINFQSNLESDQAKEFLKAMKQMEDIKTIRSYVGGKKHKRRKVRRSQKSKSKSKVVKN